MVTDNKSVNTIRERPAVGTELAVPTEHWFQFSSSALVCRIKNSEASPESWSTVDPAIQSGLIVFLTQSKVRFPSRIVLTHVRRTVALARELIIDS